MRFDRAALIHLQHGTAFASGTFRDCYIHPENPDLCVKIDHRPGEKSATAKEIRFLERPAIARRLASAPFAPYHGHVETNLGVGSIFTIIRNADSGVSSTLFDLLKSGLSPEDIRRFDPALMRFKRRFRATAIICRDLRAWNICVQETGTAEPEMILIDGFGHRYFLPLCDYIPALARRKIDEHFEIFGFQNIETMYEMYLGPDSPISRGRTA